MAQIAIVDDNDDTREVIRMLLQQEHQCSEFRDGQSFLTHLDSGETTVDLALLDIRLPDMDGAELVKIVRGRLDTPFPMIAITAHVVKDIRHTLLNAGFDEVLTKPLDFANMPTVIKRKLERS